MTNTTKKTTRLVQLSLLAAILAVLGFTPLGFIMVPPVSITILHIPVIIGAILLGPLGGGALGFEFGLISLCKAATTLAGPVDLLFSPFASGEPIQSIILCIVPRVALGVIAGLGYSLLHKCIKKESICIGITAGIATVVHTVLVLGCLWIFFQALPFRAIFLSIVTINGLCELGAAIVISCVVCVPVQKYLRATR